MRPRPASRRRSRLLVLALAAGVGLGSTLAASPASAAPTVQGADSAGLFHVEAPVTFSSPVAAAEYYRSIDDCFDELPGVRVDLGGVTSGPLVAPDDSRPVDESTFTAFKVVGTDGASGACEDLAPTTRFASSPSVSLSAPLKVDVESAAVVTNKPVGAAVDYTWTVDNGGVLSTASTSSSWTPPESASGRVVVLTTMFRALDRLRARRSVASPVAAGAFTSVTPEIIGSGRVGELMSSSVTAVPAATSSNSFWMVDGATRSGAASFVPKLSDAGKQVTLRVIVKRPGRVDTAATITRTIQPGPGYVADGPLETGRVLTFPETVELRAYTDSACTTTTPGYSLITTRQPIVPGSAAGSYLRATVPGGTGTSTCFGPVATAQLNGPVPTIDTRDGLVVGKTLRASHGTSGLRPGQTSTAWQWQRRVDGSWTDITGATAGELVITPSLAGQTLRAQATYSGTGYLPDTKASDGVTTAKGTFTAPKPTITGEAKVGSTVSASADLSGLPEGASITGYQWAYGEEIVTKLGTGSSLKIPASAKGQAIYVTVTYSAPGHEDASATSDPVGVGEGTYSAPEVTVSGSPRVGSTLSASFDASGLPSGYRASYEWQVRDGDGYSAIPTEDGESTEQGATFKPRAYLSGTPIRVKVTFSADGYPTTSVISDAVTIGNGTIDLGQPVISDTEPQVGDVLTATTTGVPVGATTVTTWGTFNTLTEMCDLEQVPATKRRVTSADLDKRLCVKVEATAAGYDGDGATSEPTEKVAKGTFTVSPLDILGTVRVGKPIVLSDGQPSIQEDSGASFRYDWFVTDADGQFQQVEGVRRESLTPAPAMDGRRLKVTVFWDIDGYETASTTSETVTIQKGSFEAPEPTIEGTAKVGSTLAASYDDEDLPEGTTPSYQWVIRSGDGSEDVEGATSSTFTPTAAMAVAKDSVAVRISYSATGYEVVSSTSDAVEVANGSLVAPKPTLSTPARINRSVTASWTGDVPALTTATYTWYADVTSGGPPRLLTSGRSSSIVVPADLVNAQLYVELSLDAPGYDSAGPTSSDKVVVGWGLQDLPAPVISDDRPRVGEPLTVSDGSWPGSTVTRRWGALNDKGDCVTTVTAETYTPSVSDLGQRICVVVTVSGVRGYEDDVQVASTQERVREPRSMKLSDTTIRKGQTFTISATDLEPGRSYTISVYDRKLTGVAGANGRISRTFTYPAKTATAKRTIAVSQYDGKTRTYYQVVSLTYTAKK